MSARERERTTGFFVDFSHQWDSFLPGCSWRDFTLVHVAGEWAQHTGRIEFELALLGLWLTATYVYDDDTPLLRDLRESRADILSQLASEDDARAALPSSRRTTE